MEEMEKQIKAQAVFAAELQYDDIPEEVTERAKSIIFDSIGCVYRGLGSRAPVLEEGKEKLLKLTLAMVSTELYEGNRKAVGHPACHILPLMLCQQEREMSLREFVRNFVAAYEVAARWGAAIRFSHDILGHGTVMTAGAAIAEGLYRGADVQNLYEALLLTGSLPEVSVWQSVWDGSRLHDAYAGLSAQKAQEAYYLLSQGVRSTGKLVESVYRDVMGAVIEPEKLSQGLGEEYLLLSNYYKVHTGCRFIHPFADVIEEELAQGLNPAAVDTIDVYTYKKAARLTAQQVPNKLAGQFSIPVAMAVQLEKGELTPDTIETCVADADVLAWQGRITLYEDEAYNRLLPEIRGGRVEFHFKNGETKSREVFHAQGDFDNPVPFTQENLKDKFRKNVKGILTEQEIRRLEEVFLGGTKDASFPVRF